MSFLGRRTVKINRIGEADLTPAIRPNQFYSIREVRHLWFLWNTTCRRQYRDNFRDTSWNSLRNFYFDWASKILSAKRFNRSPLYLVILKPIVAMRARNIFSGEKEARRTRGSVWVTIKQRPINQNKLISPRSMSTIALVNTQQPRCVDEGSREGLPAAILMKISPKWNHKHFISFFKRPIKGISECPNET